MTDKLNQPVVHVITGLGQGGAETALYRLVSGSEAPERHVIISLTDEGIFAPRLRSAGATVEALGMKSLVGALPAMWRLVRRIKALRPSIVQTWMYHADLIGGIAARLAGAQVCWGIRHSNLDASANKRSTLCVARLCAMLSSRIPALIVSCSERAIGLHRDFGYADRFVHIPNGIDTDLFQGTSGPEDIRATWAVHGDRPIFGTIGRWHPQKDYKTLLSAFGTLSAAHPSRLVLVGKGLDEENTELKELIDMHPGSIIALGQRNDVANLYGAMDIFVLSSIGEGFPNVVAEAMASGVPCIVTDVGDSREIVGETGWVVPASAPDLLARAMLDAARESTSQRAERSAQARRRVQEHFTIDRMIQAYEETWKRAARPAPKRAVLS